MRSFQFVLAVTLLSSALLGCPEPVKEQCGPANCTGCCDLLGVCQDGTTTAACGAIGDACNICLANQTCSFGSCRNPNTGGAGGSGGSGGAGGSSGLRCASGFTLCGGRCTEVRTDELNCGACGVLCTQGKFCSNGTCTNLPADCSTAACPSGYFCDSTTKTCFEGCNTNGDCPTGGTCISATHACTCPAGTQLCGSVCTPTNNANLCGGACLSCDVPNGIGACTNGTCDFTCNTGSHRCGDTCASNNSVNSCGLTSCTPCTAPANAQPACNGTSCDFTCVPGFHRCGNACVSNSDVNTCGNSCSRCPEPNGATATCDGTSCGLQCGAGTHACNGQCVSNNAIATCGNRCTPCSPPANANATCDGTSCGFTCAAGSHQCGNLCKSDIDVGSCGTSCTPCATPTNGVATCDGLACRAACNVGFHECNGQCADNTSTSSCGTSCTPCPAGPANSTPTCTSGTCGFRCATGFNACGNQCVANSATSCGTSCTVCPVPDGGTATCTTFGTCDVTCGTGFHKCGGTCVSNDSVDSCGTTSCTPCPAGPANSTRTCTQSSPTAPFVCGSTCGMGTNLCSGQCTPTDFNRACGPTCALCSAVNANEKGVCGTNGICTTACVTSCNSTCVNTQTSATNCGTCNTACAAGEKCSQGECRNQCDGGIGFTTVFPTTQGPSSTSRPLVLADVNGDGLVDLVTTDTSNAYFYAGQLGQQPFGATYTSSATLGFAATQLVAGDLNGDNKAEVIAIGPGTSAAVVRSSTTQFISAQLITPSTFVPTSVTINAFNDAGTAQALFTFNTASGTQSATMFAGGTATTPLVTVGAINANLGIGTVSNARSANITADAFADLVVTAASNALYVYPGTGNAAMPFNSANAVLAQLPSGESFSVTTAGQPFAMELADVTGDGLAEVIVPVTNTMSTGVRIYPLTAAPGFGTSSFVPTSGIVTGISAIDVNGDGARDLIVTTTAQVRVFTNGGTGTFASSAVLSVTPSTTLQSWAARDVTGDGRPEFVFQTGSLILTVPSNAAGQFPALQAIDAGNAEYLSAGDINGDGVADAVTTPSPATATSTAQVFFGAAGGSFTYGPAFPVAGDRTAVGKLSNDAFADVVSNGPRDAGATDFRIEVRFGASTGLGQPVVLSTTTQPVLFEIADMDGDAVNDLVVATGGGLEWFRNLGNSTFGPRQVIGSTVASTMAVIDINNDGKRDVVALNNSFTSSPSVVTWLNVTSSFIPGPTFTMSSSTGAMVAGDLTNDSKVDLVGGAVFSRGDGLGGFAGTTTNLQTTGPRRVLADLDNDSAIELVTAGAGSSGVFVTRGDNTPFAFAAPVSFWAGLPVADVVVAKLDGDARRDLIALQGGAGNRTLLAMPAVCR